MMKYKPNRTISISQDASTEVKRVMKHSDSSLSRVQVCPDRAPSRLGQTTKEAHLAPYTARYILQLLGIL